MTKTFSRTALALFVAGLVAFVAAGPAAAHAGLRSVDPENGSVLAVAPTSVTLTFGEPVGLSRSGVTVLDDRGTRIDRDNDEVVDGRVVEQPLPGSLGDGWYVVVWSVISEDGHVVRGASTFGVGNADAAARARADALAADVDDGTPVSQVIVRQVADVLTMVAVGAVAVAVAVASRSGQTVAVVSAALGAGFTVALALLAADEVGDLGEWAGPAHGWAVFARAAALLIVAATAYRWRAPAALAAALALASYAVVGHVRGLGKWWLDGPLLAVHLFAAALWLGAAPAMLLHLRDGRIDDESARRAARRFSLSATVALPVVVLAGAMLGLRATDLRWSAGYTGLLIAKTVVVLAAAGLGTLARRRLRAEGSRRHLVGVFAVDSALLLAATVLAATISTTRPPVHASSEHQHPNASGDAAFIEVGGCNADVSGLAVRVTLSPGRVGANAVRLAIGWASADTPGTMTLLLTSNTIGSGALDVGLTRSSELLWEGAATFPVAGDWTVAVEHRPDEFTVRRGECALRVV